MKNNANLLQFVGALQKEINKQAPAIAVGIGLVCFGTALYSAIRETPKAQTELEKKKKELNLKEDEKLPASDVFKAVWKCYVPMGISFGVGAMCILGSHKLYSKRNAAIAAAYQISETALREYRNKVVETLGEKKEQSIRNSITEDKIKNNPPVRSEVIVTGRGKTLCVDMLTNTPFESDLEFIRKTINTLNYKLRRENYVSLNDFYYEVGIVGAQLGELLGWNIDDGEIEYSYTAVMSDNGEPCIGISFTTLPKYEYWH